MTLVPARVEWRDGEPPFSTLYGDVYHPSIGAAAQARHVFISGNGLPERWRARDRFVIVETGFGLGNNFIAVCEAWRRDPDRCRELFFVSIERHPPPRADLQRAHAESSFPEAAKRLIDGWPPLTPDLHELVFEAEALGVDAADRRGDAHDDRARPSERTSERTSERIVLQLAFGDVEGWLPQLVLQADAFFLDGFAPRCNPAMWSTRVCQALARLAGRGATLATWSAAKSLRHGLADVGFDVRNAAGIGAKRDITLATYAPRFEPRKPAHPAPAAIDRPDARRALIVGAGVAGCATAWALAERGWTSVVIDRGPCVASGASGNPAGIFHGTLHGDDGPHARFNRAAAWVARKAVATAIERHGVRGATGGLLRVELRRTLAEMQSLLDRTGLPIEYVEALSAEQASRRAGLRLEHPAWWFAAGGWVDPVGLARAFLAQAGRDTELRLQTDVRELRRQGDRWQLVDAIGGVIDEAPVVVLANAGAALELIGATDWPVEAIRGQLSQVDSTVKSAAALEVQVPIAGSGYLLPRVGASIVFGATASRCDFDTGVRPADHGVNVERLRRLLGRPELPEPSKLEGRAALRWSTRDRLPLVGRVPQLDLLQREADTATARLERLRNVAREPGLFMHAALGSRGITWAALGARIVAAALSGAPAPVERSLLNAADPARFLVRTARRRATSTAREREPR